MKTMFDRLPIFDKLDKAKTVLLAGAGGGFDVFCGLPLYLWLRSLGKTVHLANLSFTDLESCDGEFPVPSLLRVNPDTSGPSYFPELSLSQWLSERFEPTPVYAIARSGARPVLAAYEWLVQDLRPDTVILVDGGTDSLLRGDEIDLGTPQEDMASLYAAHTVRGPRQKFLLCLGFGIDTFHGVCHAHFLENVASLIEKEAYLGAWSLLEQTEEFRLYRLACEFAMKRLERYPSIVNTSIISAVQGRFGDHHATKRTAGSPLFINPLMSLYWAFELRHVAQRNLYLERIANTDSYHELSLVIERFRASQPSTRPWTDIPH